jgi:hypothetical protein
LKKHRWFAEWNKVPHFKHTLESDETISNLLLSKEYRRDLEQNNMIQKQFKEIIVEKINKNF